MKIRSRPPSPDLLLLFLVGMLTILLNIYKCLVQNNREHESTNFSWDIPGKLSNIPKQGTSVSKNVSMQVRDILSVYVPFITW